MRKLAHGIESSTEQDNEGLLSKSFTPEVLWVYNSESGQQLSIFRRMVTFDSHLAHSFRHVRQHPGTHKKQALLLTVLVHVVLDNLLTTSLGNINSAMNFFVTYSLLAPSLSLAPVRPSKQPFVRYCIRRFRCFKILIVLSSHTNYSLIWLLCPTHQSW